MNLAPLLLALPLSFQPMPDCTETWDYLLNDSSVKNKIDEAWVMTQEGTEGEHEVGGIVFELRRPLRVRRLAGQLALGGDAPDRRDPRVSSGGRVPHASWAGP